MEQILWLEVLLKGAVALALVFVPLTTIRVLGLPRLDTGFWPRIVGGLLLGIAAAVYALLAFPDAKGGLGPAGLVAINLSGAGVVIGALIMNAAAQTRRGRVAIVLAAIFMLALAFVEIAHL